MGDLTLHAHPRLSLPTLGIVMDPRDYGEPFMEASDRLLPALDALAERYGLPWRQRLRELGANPYIRTDMDPHLTALVHRVALTIIAEALVRGASDEPPLVPRPSPPAPPA